jgi:hypothetical protein
MNEGVLLERSLAPLQRIQGRRLALRGLLDVWTVDEVKSLGINLSAEPAGLAHGLASFRSLVVSVPEGPRLLVPFFCSGPLLLGIESSAIALVWQVLLFGLGSRDKSNYSLH